MSDIVEILSQPLVMSMFRNSGDLYAEMAGQRKLAADEITSLRARIAVLEASRDGYVKQNAARAEESDRWKDRANRSEAMCADLAKAMENLIGIQGKTEYSIAPINDACASLASYRKERPDAL